MDRELKTNRHSKYSLIYHLVVVTKYRNKCITPEMLLELEKIFIRLLESQNSTILEFNGEEDYVHILFETPPQVQLSKLVNTLKTVSSRLIRKKFKNHLNEYYSKPIFWSRSYCIISTGEASIEIVKKYIQNQGKNQNRLNSSPPK